MYADVWAACSSCCRVFSTVAECQSQSQELSQLCRALRWEIYSFRIASDFAACSACTAVRCTLRGEQSCGLSLSPVCGVWGYCCAAPAGLGQDTSLGQQSKGSCKGLYYPRLGCNCVKVCSFRSISPLLFANCSCFLNRSWGKKMLKDFKQMKTHAFELFIVCLE